MTISPWIFGREESPPECRRHENGRFSITPRLVEETSCIARGESERASLAKLKQRESLTDPEPAGKKREGGAALRSNTAIPLAAAPPQLALYTPRRRIALYGRVSTPAKTQ